MRLSAIFLAGVAEAQFGGFGGLSHLRFGCEQLTIERLDPYVLPPILTAERRLTMHREASSTPAKLPRRTCIRLSAGTPSMLRCLRKISLNSRRARLAVLPTTARTTGLRTSTSRPATELTSVFLRLPTGISHNSRLELCRWIPLIQRQHRLLFGDRFTTQTNGGVTVYYISPGPGEVTAFQPVSPFTIPTRWVSAYLSPSRASECSSVTLCGASPYTKCRAASAASTVPTLAATIWLPAPTRLSITKASHLVLARGSDLMSFTRRKKFLDAPRS